MSTPNEISMMDAVFHMYSSRIY